MDRAWHVVGLVLEPKGAISIFVSIAPDTVLPTYRDHLNLTLYHLDPDHAMGLRP